MMSRHRISEKYANFVRTGDYHWGYPKVTRFYNNFRTRYVALYFRKRTRIPAIFLQKIPVMEQSGSQDWGKYILDKNFKRELCWTCKHFPKKHTFLISNGWFWWLSCDRPWSAIIYIHWQNHEPRSLTIMIDSIKKIWATITHDRQMIVNDRRSRSDRPISDFKV